MAENSKIEWTDHTFNPWRGCTKVAPGCANCYADAQSKRNPKVLGIWGENGTRVVASEASWQEPLKWNRIAEKKGVRHRVFCASLADVFEDWESRMVASSGADLLVCDVCGAWHEDTDASASGTCKCGRPLIRMEWATMGDVRARLFRLIDDTPQLDWLLLTKRPSNILRMVYDAWTEKVAGYVSQNEGDGRRWQRRDNVWLGTSIACQEDAEKNIPELLSCRDLAPVLFLSVEPLIGPVNLSCDPHPGMATLSEINGWERKRIDWVIVGGESGSKARPCNVEWIRSIVRQCQDAGVPCFVKQLGAHVIDTNGFRGVPVRVRTRDQKGGDPVEWLEDLRVRQFPQRSLFDV